jgi:shikimate kinase
MTGKTKDNSMKNIVLTGFMGTGKTEVGRELSRLLGMSFIDIDHEIEKSEGCTITALFASRGEEYFRQVEASIIRQFSSVQGAVISTGGGAVLREENIKTLQSTGVIICLTADLQTILQRTDGHDNRPLLLSADRKARITELLEQRKPFYEKAGTMIDTEGKTPLQVAEEIIEKVSWTK